MAYGGDWLKRLLGMPSSPIPGGSAGAQGGGGSGWGDEQSNIPGTSSPKSIQPAADATPELYAQYGGGYADTPAVPGSGGTGATSPDYSEVKSRLSSLQNLYSQLFGDVDKTTLDRRSQLDQNYGQQQGQLNEDYAKTSQQLPYAYASRGLSNSSYFENAQNEAGQNYQEGLNSLNQGRDQNYAQLGQFASTQKARLGAGRDQLNQIDLSQYTNPTDLMNLRNQLDQQLGSLQQTRAGLQTSPEYIQGLNAITPTQQQGSAKLAQQLQTLGQSGASSYAKQQIFQGLLRSAGVDPREEGYWRSYFQNLVG